MTRTSGFKVHKETSGGEFERLKVNAYEVPAGGSLALSFTLPAHDAKAFCERYLNPILPAAAARGKLSE